MSDAAYKRDRAAWLKAHGICVKECPYWEKCDEYFEDCTTALAKDAIALLKAQEPVEPTIGGDATGQCGNWWYQCGKCKDAIDYHDKYCRACGQAVKWDG